MTCTMTDRTIRNFPPNRVVPLGRPPPTFTQVTLIKVEKIMMVTASASCRLVRLRKTPAGTKSSIRLGTAKLVIRARRAAKVLTSVALVAFRANRVLLRPKRTIDVYLTRVVTVAAFSKALRMDLSTPFRPPALLTWAKVFMTEMKTNGTTSTRRKWIQLPLMTPT